MIITRQAASASSDSCRPAFPFSWPAHARRRAPSTHPCRNSPAIWEIRRRTPGAPVGRAACHRDARPRSHPVRGGL